MMRKIGEWAREKPHELIIALITIAIAIASLAFGAIQALYAISDHTVKQSTINQAEQSRSTSPIKPINPTRDKSNSKDILDSQYSNPVKQEIFMKSYLLEILEQTKYENKIGRNVAEIVFARPPFLNVQYGVGTCNVEASITSGSRVLVFQNRFEGHSTKKDQESSAELENEACHDVVKKMLDELE